LTGEVSKADPYESALCALQGDSGKVEVLRDQDAVGVGCVLPNQSIRGFAKTDIDHVSRVNAELGGEHPRQCRWELVIDAEPSRGYENCVIELPGGVLDGSEDVLALQVRIVFENFLKAGTGAEQFEDVDYADAHPANARPSAALCVVDGDPRQQCGLCDGLHAVPVYRDGDLPGEAFEEGVGGRISMV